MVFFVCFSLGTTINSVIEDNQCCSNLDIWLCSSIKHFHFLVVNNEIFIVLGVGGIYYVCSLNKE